MGSGWRKYFAGKDIGQGVIDTLKKAIKSSGVNVEISDSEVSNYHPVYDTITINMSAGNGMKTDWIVAHELFERHQFKTMFNRFMDFEKHIMTSSYVSSNSDLVWYMSRVRRSSHMNIMVMVDEALLAYQMGRVFFEYIQDYRFRELDAIEVLYYSSDCVKDIDYVRRTRKIYSAVWRKGDAIMKKFKCNRYSKREIKII